MRSSLEFEERYTPNWAELYESSETTRETKSSLSSESSVLLYPSKNVRFLRHSHRLETKLLDTVKTENVDLHPKVSVDRNDTASPPKPPVVISLETKENESQSDQESGNSSVIDVGRRQSNSSGQTTSDDFYSVASDEIKAKVVQSEESQDVEEVQVKVEPSESTSKWKLVDYDDSGSERNEEEEKPFELEIPEDLLPTFDNTRAEVEDSPSSKAESEEKADLPIALRRSKRTRRANTNNQSSSSSSSSKSSVSSSRILFVVELGKFRLQITQSKRSAEQKWRNARRPTGRSRNGRRRRRFGRYSSTSTENEKASEDDDDDLEDALSNGDDDLIEEVEESGDDGAPRATAKTVAKIFEKMTLTGRPASILPSITCFRCGKSDRPESLLLCEDCDDAYHLECNQPELFAIPESNWFCSFCDHKRLCDGLIEKLLQLIKDDRYSQIKRRIGKVKRILPPFQEYPRPGVPRPKPVVVPVHLPPVVPKVAMKRRINTILSSDEEEEPQQKQPVKRKTISIDERIEAELINNFKSEPVEQQSQQEENPDEEPGKRRMRTCRKQTTDYRYNEFDSKIKEAIIETTTEKSHADSDSDATEIMSEGEKQKIETLHQEFDNDFDGSDGRNHDDDDFVPYARRFVHSPSFSIDFPTLSLDRVTKIVEQRPKKTPMTLQPRRLRNRRRRKNGNGNDELRIRQRRKNPRQSKDETFLLRSQIDTFRSLSELRLPSDDERPTRRPMETAFVSESRKENVFTGFFSPVADATEGGNIPIDTDLKGEANVVFKQDEGVFVSVKTRRQRRAPAKKKKNAIQQENISEEEEGNQPLPTKRPYNRRRSGSDDSFIGDGDDYDKLAHKRRLFHHGKVIERKSILSHIKKLVGNEEEGEEDEDEEEDEEEEREGEEGENDPEKTNEDGEEEAPKEKKKAVTKKKKEVPNDYDEQLISDDDDFPDEQEIMRTIGVTDLKSAPTTVPVGDPTRLRLVFSFSRLQNASIFRCQFMAPMQNYQFSMIDPTAHLDFLAPVETTPAEPSDPTENPSEPNPPAATENV